MLISTDGRLSTQLGRSIFSGTVIQKIKLSSDYGE